MDGRRHEERQGAEERVGQATVQGRVTGTKAGMGSCTIGGVTGFLGQIWVLMGRC